MRAVIIAIAISLAAAFTLPASAAFGRTVRCKPGYFFHHRQRRCVRRAVRRHRVPHRRNVRRKPVRRRPVRRQPVRRQPVRRQPPPRRRAGPRYVTAPARSWPARKFATPTTHVMTSRGRQRTQYCGRKGYYMGRSNGRAVCYKTCPVSYLTRKYGPPGRQTIYCVDSCRSRGGRLLFRSGREQCVACPAGYSFNNPRRRCEKRI